jgi:hypothetical protein
MAKIPPDFGTGGSGLTPGGSTTGPDLATVARDIADDLATVKGTATAVADANDLASAIALVNDLKAKHNAVAGAVLKTTKG